MTSAEGGTVVLAPGIPHSATTSVADAQRDLPTTLAAAVLLRRGHHLLGELLGCFLEIKQFMALFHATILAHILSYCTMLCL